jgi:two-component system OmpR family sensor kinase/two-component system sensor histidine kinase BaeS
MTNPTESPPETPPEWTSRRYSRRHFGHRPRWWPENEPWPPEGGRPRHHPAFRRFGCFFAFVILLLCGLLFTAPVLIGFLLGQVDFSHLSASAPYLAGLAVFILAIVFAMGYGLRRLFTPLDDLLFAADRVAEGDYSVHVEERGPREVRSLARAFNNMASRLHLADEQRRNLLADVTHELHTPLTVIQGNLEGMLDGIYPSDEANLRSLLNETVMLSRLVEDLRTLALAESGALKLRKEVTDLSMLIRDTLAVFQSQADAAGVTITAEIVDDIPWIEVDPARIRQVLSNLLANAFRYTPAGGLVRVKYSLSAEHARIEVQDTGSGIPVEDLPHVFDRFYKSTDSRGTGLGLAIAKHLVTAHGGTISAESSPGNGTTISISLPVDE